MLLFNIEYVPLLKYVDQVKGMGYLFHYVFCIVSVLALYYILMFIREEKNMLAYIVIFTLGSAILYSLTGLTDIPPSITDYIAWFYWTLGHALYGIVVGYLIRRWDR